MTAACLVCKSQNKETWAYAADVEYHSTEEVFTYYKCLDCGILYIWPVPSQQLSIIYPSNYYAFSDRRNLLTSVKEMLDKRNFRNILKKLPNSQLNVLDIGGGTGWLLNIVRQADSRVAFTQVVDIDNQAKLAATKHGHAYFCGRIEEFKTETKFHVILLLNLIEHVQYPREILQKTKELLAEDGVIMIKTPNYDSLDCKIFRHRNWGGYHCPRHWTLFTKETMNCLVKEEGFDVTSFSYTQGAPFWSVSILAYLSRKGWISKQRPELLYSLFCTLFALFDFMRRPFAKTSQMFFILKHKSCS